MLSWTPIPRIASAIEGAWYLSQDGDEFDLKFNSGVSSGASSASVASAKSAEIDPAVIGAIAEAVRQLDQLRADGLISEYEFEQKRRQMLDRIG
jgi:hypothetical protein